MVRVMRESNTDIYRVLVEILVEGEWQTHKIYGPYDMKFSARNYDRHRWTEEYYVAGGRRAKRQKLDIGESGTELVWSDDGDL